MKANKSTESDAQVLAIILGFPVLILTNTLISKQSDNLWVNLSIGMGLALLFGYTVYVIGKKSKN